MRLMRKYAGTRERFLIGIVLAFLSVAPIIAKPVIAGAIPSTYTVTFFENDNASDSTSTYQLGTSAQNLTSFADLSPAFSNPGYTFDDWNTSANGNGTSYADASQYSFSSDLSLYAQWTPEPSVHTVTFFENDNVSDNTSTYQLGTSAQNLTAFADLSPALSNPGFTFDDWNTSANGSGTSYANGSQYSFSSDLSLYAQWTAQVSVTASFSNNGGSGSISSIQDPSGTTITLPTAGDLTRID
ncbi:MAG: InlB B-repeat-containing protein, partial [Acidimicrobiales bacterium]